MTYKNLFSVLTIIFIAIFLVGAGSVFADPYAGVGTFNKITSLDDLDSGYYVIVNSGDAKAMSNDHTDSLFNPTDVTPSSGEISNPDATIVWKIEQNAGGHTIFSEASSKYVSYTGSSNNIQITDSVEADNQRWVFTYESNVFKAENLSVTGRFLQYNASNPRFVCYTGTQQDLLLYKLDPTSLTVPTILINLPTADNDTYYTGTYEDIIVSGSKLNADTAFLYVGGDLKDTVAVSNDTFSFLVGSDTGLLENDFTVIEIVAFDGNNYSDTSNIYIYVDTVDPNMVEANLLVDTIYYGGLRPTIRFNEFTDVTGISEYTIYLSKNEDFSAGIITGSNGVNNFTPEEDLTFDETWYIRVSAEDGVGNLNDSAIYQDSFTVIQANVETFNNYPESTTSYNSGTFLGQDGSTWTYEKCAGSASITGKSITIGRNQTPVSEFYSGTISNGIGILSFNFMQVFGTNVNLNVLVNDSVVANVTTSGEQNNIKNSGNIIVNIPGDFVIKFINANSSDGQVAVDDITWTSLPTGDLSISITSPQDGYDTIADEIEISGIALNAESGNSVIIYRDNSEVGSVQLSGDSLVWSGTVSGLEAGANQVWVKLIHGDSVAYDTITVNRIIPEIWNVSAAIPYSETFVTDLGNCTNLTITGSNPWSNSSEKANCNGYQGTGLEEHWLLLPYFNIPADSNLEMSFMTYSQYGTIDNNNYLKLFYSTDYNGKLHSDYVNQSNWTELVFNIPDNPTPAGVDAGKINLSSISGETVYFAFKYYATNSPTSWSIDDIIIAEVDISNEEIIEPDITVDTEYTAELGNVAGSDTTFIIKQNNADTLVVKASNADASGTLSLSVDFQDTGNSIKINPVASDTVNASDTANLKDTSKGMFINLKAYDISNNIISNFTNHKIQLSFDYSGLGLDENKVGLFRLHSDNKWYDVTDAGAHDGLKASSIDNDTVNKIFTADLNGFSDFYLGEGADPFDENYAPVVQSISVDGEWSNDTFLAGETYLINIIYSDTNTADDIDTMEIKIFNGIDTIHFYSVRGETAAAGIDDSGKAYVSIFGDTVISGNTVSCTWLVDLSWLLSDDADYKIYAKADDSDSAGDWYEIDQVFEYINTISLVWDDPADIGLNDGDTILINTNIDSGTWESYDAFYKGTVIPINEHNHHIADDFIATFDNGDTFSLFADDLVYNVGYDSKAITCTFSFILNQGQFDEASANSITFYIVYPDLQASRNTPQTDTGLIYNDSFVTVLPLSIIGNTIIPDTLTVFGFMLNSMEQAIIDHSNVDTVTLWVDADKNNEFSAGDTKIADLNLFLDGDAPAWINSSLNYDLGTDGDSLIVTVKFKDNLTVDSTFLGLTAPVKDLIETEKTATSTNSMGFIFTDKFTVDFIPIPVAAITITSPEDGYETNVQEITISGTVDNISAGDTIAIYTDETLNKIISLDANDTTWTGTAALTGLGNVVKAIITANDAEYSDTIIVNYYQNGLKPIISGPVTESNVYITFDYNSDITIQGNAAPHDTIYIYVNNVLKDSKVTVDGEWQFLIGVDTGLIVNYENIIGIAASYEDGPISDSALITIIIDTAAPILTADELIVNVANANRLTPTVEFAAFTDTTSVDTYNVYFSTDITFADSIVVMNLTDTVVLPTLTSFDTWYVGVQAIDRWGHISEIEQGIILISVKTKLLVVSDTPGEPVLTQYLGDYINPEQSWIYFAVDQVEWDSAYIGFGDTHDVLDFDEEDTAYYLGLNNEDTVIGRNFEGEILGEIGDVYYAGKIVIGDQIFYADTDAATYNNTTLWTGEFIRILPLGVPSNFTASRTNSTTINLTWNNWFGELYGDTRGVMIVAVEDADLTDSPEQDMEYDLGAAVENGRVIYKGMAESFTHDADNPHLAVEEGKIYNYYIFTNNNDFYSDSATVSIFTPKAPTIPVLSIIPADWTNVDSFTIVIDSVSTHWNDNTPEYRYQVGGTAPADTDAGILFGSTDTYGVQISGLGGETTIWVFAVADNGGGYLTKSENVELTAKLDKTPPAAITDFDTVSISYRNVQIEWTALTHDNLSPFETYEIFWTDNGNEPDTTSSKLDKVDYSSLGNITTSNLIIESLNPDSTYILAIRGVDSLGNEGELSDTLTFTTLAIEGNVPPEVIDIKIDTGNEDYLLAGETYSVKVRYMDPNENGRQEIEFMELKIKLGVDTTVHFSSERGTTANAISYGAEYVSSLSIDTTAIDEFAVDVTWTFNMNWNLTEAANYRISARAIDESDSSSLWNEIDNDIEYVKTLGLYGDLLANGASIIDGDTVFTNTNFNWTGLTVKYKGTEVSPNESYFNILMTNELGDTEKQATGSALNISNYAVGSDSKSRACTFTVVDIPDSALFDESTIKIISFNVIYPYVQVFRNTPYDTSGYIYNDSFVTILPVSIIGNTDEEDTLTRFIIVNYGSVDVNSVDTVTLWVDADKNNEFSAGDTKLSDLSVDSTSSHGGVWYWEAVGLEYPLGTDGDSFVVTVQFKDNLRVGDTFFAIIALPDNIKTEKTSTLTAGIINSDKFTVTSEILVPYIEITSPADDSETSAQTITVSGITLNTNSGDTVEIRARGELIDTLILDETGIWNKDVQLDTGLNLITVKLYSGEDTSEASISIEFIPVNWDIKEPASSDTEFTASLGNVLGTDTTYIIRQSNADTVTVTISDTEGKGHWKIKASSFADTGNYIRIQKLLSQVVEDSIKEKIGNARDVPGLHIEVKLFDAENNEVEDVDNIDLVLEIDFTNLPLTAYRTTIFKLIDNEWQDLASLPDEATDFVRGDTTVSFKLKKLSKFFVGEAPIEITITEPANESITVIDTEPVIISGTVFNAAENDSVQIWINGSNEDTVAVLSGDTWTYTYNFPVDIEGDTTLVIVAKLISDTQTAYDTVTVNYTDFVDIAIITPADGSDIEDTVIVVITGTSINVLDGDSVEIKVNNTTVETVSVDSGYWEYTLVLDGTDTMLVITAILVSNSEVTYTVTVNYNSVSLKSNLNNVFIAPNPFRPNDGNWQTGEYFTGSDEDITNKTGIQILNLTDNAKVEVYDILGRKLRTLTNIEGYGMAIWDVRDSKGILVSSGTYLIVISNDVQTVVRKAAVIK